MSAPRDAREWPRIARFRTILAGLFALLTLLAYAWPTWIESATRTSPDGGDGSFELLLAVLAGVATVVTAGWAGFAWRRAAGARG